MGARTCNGSLTVIPARKITTSIISVLRDDYLSASRVWNVIHSHHLHWMCARVILVCFILTMKQSLVACSQQETGPAGQVTMATRPPELNVSSSFYDIPHGDTFTIFCLGDIPIEWVYDDFMDGNVRVSVTEVASPATTTYDHASILRLVNAQFNDTRMFACRYVAAAAAGGGDAKDAQLLDTQDSSSTSIYLYVNDPNNWYALAPGMMAGLPLMSVVFSQDPFNIPCRPTSSNIDVVLEKNINNGEVVQLGDDVVYNPFTGFAIKYPNIFYDHDFTCIYHQNGQEKEVTVLLHYSPKTDYVAPPEILEEGTEHLVIGDAFRLTCVARSEGSVSLFLQWDNIQSTDDGRVTVTSPTQSVDSRGNYVYREVSTTLRVTSATLADKKVYRCNVHDHNNIGNHVDTIVFVYNSSQSFVQLSADISHLEVPPGQKNVTFVVNIRAWPRPLLQWHKGDKFIPNIGNYEMGNTSTSAYLRILQLEPRDAGVYTFSARIPDGTEEHINITLVIHAAPLVEIPFDTPMYFEHNEEHVLHCWVTGVPVPLITWEFQKCLTDACNLTPNKWIDVTSQKHLSTNMENASDPQLGNDEASSALSVFAVVSGVYRCIGRNKLGKNSTQVPFYVSDVATGFGILREPAGYDLLTDMVETVENTSASCTCRANRYKYNAPRWTLEDSGEVLIKNNTMHGLTVAEYRTKYSHVAVLNFDGIELQMSGTYYCSAVEQESVTELPSRVMPMAMEVKQIQPPVWISRLRGMLSRDAESMHNMTCQADGFPEPTFMWYKDGVLLDASTATGIISKNITQGQMLIIERLVKEDDGLYECEASNLGDIIRSGETLKVIVLAEGGVSPGLLVGVILAILIICILAVWLIWKLYFRRQLKKWAVIATRELNPDRSIEGEINPDIPIQDQAELLSFDPRYEFPKERLTLGKKLGQGAFGCVMRAQAVGIDEQEASTTVAVKMLKERILVDMSQRKALLSEIKILIHIGHHLNIVNLLGVITKHGILFLIMEYCKFGSLREFLRKNRSNFVYEPDGSNLDDDSVTNGNRSRVTSVADVSAAMSRQASAVSDNLTQTTGLTGDTEGGGEEGRANRGQSIRKQKPITVQDLLTYAYQVARGMEFLASQKCIHRDLAARNVLVADDDVVKICDFGLAKDMEMYPDYVKQSAGPMPIKWMPLESILDKVFSSQSDVWAFGILLYEMFALGGSPYPGIEINNEFIQRLKNGYRMSKPIYAPRETYRVMQECWKEEPEQRPTFHQLVQKIGNMLEGDIRQHYLDLNNTYLRLLDDSLDQRATANTSVTDLTPGGAHPYYVNVPDEHGYVNLPTPVRRDEVTRLTSSNNSNNADAAVVVATPPPLHPGYDSLPLQTRKVDVDKSPRPMRKVSERPRDELRGKPGVLYVTNIPDDGVGGGARERQAPRDDGEKFAGPASPSYANDSLAAPRGHLTSDSDTSSGYWGENAEPPSYNVVMMAATPPSSPRDDARVDAV